MNDINKLKSIKKLNTTSFVILAITILFSILFIVNIVLLVYDAVPNDITSSPYFGLMIASVVLFLIFLFTLSGLSLVLGLKILSMWDDKKVDNIKTVWGILTIVLLGPISSAIFYNQANKIINSNKENNLNEPVNNYQQ